MAFFVQLEVTGAYKCMADRSPAPSAPRTLPNVFILRPWVTLRETYLFPRRKYRDPCEKGLVADHPPRRDTL